MPLLADIELSVRQQRRLCIMGKDKKCKFERNLMLRNCW